jgi:hypothetical protein
MSNSSNTGVSGETANAPLRDSGKPADSCIGDQVAEEITSRFFAEYDPESNTGIEVSVSPPGDLTKIWFEQDGSGAVVAIKYYNSTSGQWEEVVSTDSSQNQEAICEDNNALYRTEDGCLRVDLDKFLEVSENSGQLIIFDQDGKILVSETEVKKITAAIDETNKCNVIQRNADGDIAVDRGANGYIQIGPSGGIIQGEVIQENTTDPLVRTFDLTTAANIPAEVDWDNCPPTHVQVTAVISIKNGSGSSAGTWLAPTVFISCGFDQTRVAVAVDADSAEGSDTNTAIVRLNPSDPKTFTYIMDDIGAPAVNWADVKNHMGLYVQALIWGGPITP